MKSEITSHKDGIVTAKLVLDAPFNKSCAGDVQCVVALEHQVPSLQTEYVTHTVSLVHGMDHKLTHATQFQLNLKSRQLYVCSLWTEEEKSQINVNLGRTLSRSIAHRLNEDRNCVNISSLTCDKDRVIVSGNLLDCQSDGTSSYVGEMTTLYLLLRWKNRGPLISLNGTLYEVDPEFPLCSIPSECGLSLAESAEDNDDHLVQVIVGLCVASGVILFLVVISFVVILSCKLHKLFKSRINTSTTPARRREEMKNHYV